MISSYRDVFYQAFDTFREQLTTLRQQYHIVNIILGGLVLTFGWWAANQLDLVDNFLDFGLLQLVLYVALWAMLGSLPGYFLFYIRNYNPGVGLRVGGIAGIGFGTILAGTASYTLEQIVVNTLFLWALAALIGMLMPPGHHDAQASGRFQLAGLGTLLLPALILLVALAISLGTWGWIVDKDLVSAETTVPLASQTISESLDGFATVLEFSVFKAVLFFVLWSIIGGLPGFYMFYSRNHNPRTGARLGMVTGLGLGVLFAGVDSLEAGEIFNNALFLWVWALVLSFFIPRGNHTESSTMSQRIADLAYGLLLPTFLLVIAIVVVPMLWNLLFAFRPIRMRTLQHVDILSLEDLSFDNFDRVFSSRRGRFWRLLRISLIYTFAGSILAIFMGLVAALIVKDKFPGRSIFRGILLFPYIAPIVAVTFIWQELLAATTSGFINELLVNGGVLDQCCTDGGLISQRIDFLRDKEWALYTVILFQGWRYFPFAFLFILARIQAIPDELYEAAKVDGAAPSQRLMHITLPQLRAVFGTLFLLRFIWTFNKFEDIFLLNGGAGDTEVLPVQVYEWLFSRKDVGASSAVALVMAVVLFLLVGIYFKWFLVEED